MSVTRIELRGEFSIDGMSHPVQTRELLLIAFLCTQRNHRCLRTTVAESLWPEVPRNLQLGSLRQVIARASGFPFLRADRGMVWLESVSTDLDDFVEWRPILPDWNHAWLEDYRALDRDAHATKRLKQASQIEDPIEKIAALLDGLRANPIDETLCADLIEIYEALGWQTEIALAVKEIERNLATAGMMVSTRRLSSLIRPSPASTLLSPHGLSATQNIEFVHAIFPVLLSTGQFMDAQSQLTALFTAGGMDAGQETKSAFYLSKSLMMLGKVVEAKQCALEYQGRSDTEFALLLRAYRLYISDQFDETYRMLSGRLAERPLSPEARCEALAMLCPAAKLSHRPAEAQGACEEGLRVATQISSSFWNVVFQGLQLWLDRENSDQGELVSQYRRLASYAEQWDFRVLRAGYQSEVGKTLRELGSLVEAEETLLECVQYCDSNQLTLRLGVALDYLGETYLSMRRYSEAAITFQRSVLLRRESNEDGALCTGLRGAGLALLGLREYALARKMFMKCLPIYLRLGHMMQYGICMIYRAKAEDELDLDSAIVSREQGLRAIRESGAPLPRVKYEVGDEIWGQIADDLAQVSLG